MSAGHARIAPSGLALTVECTASVTMQESVPPQPPTEEKAEGTAGHVVAERAARGEVLPLGSTFKSEGREWTVDVDMFNGAAIYAKALGGTHSTLRLEDPVKTSAIHPEHSYGTPDAWRMFEFKDWAKAVGEAIAAPFVARGYTHVVRVGDYKYGHRFVDVFENWQLVDYGYGVLERLQLSDEFTLFEFILVQPRAYHREGKVRYWRVPAIQLRAMINVAFNKAHEALGPNPVARTGEHCVDCAARALCATYRQTTAHVIDYTGTPELMPLDAVAMGQELRLIDAALDRLNGRREGLAIAVESTLRAGARVPHYEMAPGRSNLQWREGVTQDEIANFGDLIGINLRKPLAVFTPTQCVDAGVSETAILEDYAHRPPAPLRLKASNAKDIRKALAK